MPGKMMPWGWVPDLPVCEARCSVYPRSLKPQPIHSITELQLVKIIPKGESSGSTARLYVNTIDFEQLVKLDILL